MDCEASQQRIGRAAEQVASSKVDDDRPVTYCTGREIGHHTAVSDVDERRLLSVHRLFQRLSQAPVNAGAVIPAIEVQDLDLDSQLMQAPHLLLDDHAGGRTLPRRIHVGDDEQPHALTRLQRMPRPGIFGYASENRITGPVHAYSVPARAIEHPGVDALEGSHHVLELIVLSNEFTRAYSCACDQVGLIDEPANRAR